MAPAPKRTDAGLKKISAERSITFLPQMPLPQKREVRQLEGLPNKRFVNGDEITHFLVEQLGGSNKSYGRDRKNAHRDMAFEVLSPPRVTAHLGRFKTDNDCCSQILREVSKRQWLQ